jgi:hypothetical protein
MDKVGKVHGVHAVNADQQHMTYGSRGRLLRMGGTHRRKNTQHEQNKSKGDAHLSETETQYCTPRL